MNIKNTDNIKKTKKNKNLTKMEEPVLTDIDKKDFDSLVSSYPQHLSLIKDQQLYVTPILVGELDLKLTKLKKKNFERVYKLLQIKFINHATPLTLSSEELYDKYISIS